MIEIGPSPSAVLDRRHRRFDRLAKCPMLPQIGSGRGLRRTRGASFGYGAPIFTHSSKSLICASGSFCGLSSFYRRHEQCIVIRPHPCPCIGSRRSADSYPDRREQLQAFPIRRPLAFASHVSSLSLPLIFLALALWQLIAPVLQHRAGSSSRRTRSLPCSATALLPLRTSPCRSRWPAISGAPENIRCGHASCGLSPFT